MCEGDEPSIDKTMDDRPPSIEYTTLHGRSIDHLAIGPQCLPRTSSLTRRDQDIRNLQSGIGRHLGLASEIDQEAQDDLALPVATLNKTSGRFRIIHSTVHSEVVEERGGTRP